MAEKSYLWDAAGGGDQSPHTEAETTDMFRALLGGSGVLNFLNNLAPTVSGAAVLIDTGAAMVDGHPYYNSASKSTTITTPSIGTTGHRIVLRCTWGSTQTVRITDISSADNTAAIPAKTTTSGTTFDVTLATLTITTGGVITLTDGREWAAGSARGMRLVGSSVTATNMTGTSAADLVTVAGLNIPVTSWIMVRFTFRKQALAARAAAFGLKINSTVVMEAADSATAAARTSATNQAEAGFAEILIPPRETANYGFGVRRFYASFTTAAAPAAGSGIDTTDAPTITAALPQAAVTSVILRGFNSVSSVVAEIDSVQVYEMAVS